MNKQNSEADVSLKGLDDFSSRFLFGERNDSEDEYIATSEGQEASKEAMDKYMDTRKVEFMKRATAFTTDLIAFIMEQRSARNLTDTETIFGLALANINLRNAYGLPQGNEKQFTSEDTEKLLEEFDEICAGAQDYWDANT